MFCYVGQTRQGVERRWANHKYGKGAISQALRMFGVDRFTVVVLERTVAHAANEREDYWVERLGTLWPNGLNKQRGGSNGHRTQRARDNHSAAMKRKWADPEFRSRADTWLRSPKRSELGRAAARNFRTPEAQARLAQKMKDPEVRRRMSEAAKRRCADPEWRRMASERARLQAARKREEAFG